MPFYHDSTMLLLIPAMLFALWAQYMVKSTFAKYSKIDAAAGYKGSDVALRILRESGIPDVKVEPVPGSLTDHYDPRSKVLRLSQDIYNGKSIAALGVAAHEAGHAIQHKHAFGAFQLRQTIFPVANIGSSLAFPLFLLGLIMTSPSLMDIGILMFAAAVLFQVVTLPVEFNASSRALAMLESRGYLQQQEIGSARKVLRAAAMTYVAATGVAAMNLVRMLLLSGSSRD